MNDRNMLPFRFLQAVLLTFLSSTLAVSVDVIITNIDLPSPGGTSFVICWSGNTGAVTYSELTVIQPGVTQKSLSGTADSSTKCATFENDISLIVEAGDPVAFILRLFLDPPPSISELIEERTDPDGKGEASLTWPDVNTIFECDSAYKVAGATAEMKIFRLHYTNPITSGDRLITDNGDEFVTVGNSDPSQNTVYYLRDVISRVPKSLKICRQSDATINEVEGQTMDLCSSPTDVPDVTLAAPAITAVELNYETKETKMTATPTADSDAYETVHYWDNDTPNPHGFSAVCTSGSTCSVGLYETGLKTLNIILVGYKTADNAVMLEAVRHPFQDFNLVVSVIFTTTLEMRWEPKGPGTSTFTITIKCDKQPAVFDSATVTCSVDDSGCYGYFLEIPNDATTCTTTLQPEINSPRVPDEKNKIIHVKTKVPQAQKTEYDLNIRHAQMKWIHEFEASVLVCFNHTSYDTETVFSHYEFVMVNQKGQWLKHKLLTQDTEGDICFSPFTVNTNTFDMTERVNLLVTQRATDGFTVLAGEETYISFNRNSNKSSTDSN